tara:strand:- start:556 stop:729 length:174 start_codon:yes stop_codon:yes gene_type:complete
VEEKTKNKVKETLNQLQKNHHLAEKTKEVARKITEEAANDQINLNLIKIINIFNHGG